MDEKTILYIEDNFHNRRIVRKILGTRGYTVIEAEDGLVGYEMICDLKPPLVLLDIALPHLDGIQIVQRLRADKEIAHIPVVALTASAMRGDRERFLEAGCNDYLSKPVRATELIDMVDKYFANGAADAPKKKKTAAEETTAVESKKKAASKKTQADTTKPEAIVEAPTPAAAKAANKKAASKKTQADTTKPEAIADAPTPAAAKPAKKKAASKKTQADITKPKAIVDTPTPAAANPAKKKVAPKKTSADTTKPKAIVDAPKPAASKPAKKKAASKKTSADTTKPKAVVDAPAPAKNKKAKKETIRADNIPESDPAPVPAEPEPIPVSASMDDVIASNVAEILSIDAIQPAAIEGLPDNAPIQPASKQAPAEISAGAAIWVIDANPADARLTRRILAAKLKLDAIDVSSSTQNFSTVGPAPKLVIFGTQRSNAQLFEVLKLLRSDEQMADVPIFMLTTESLDEQSSRKVARYVDQIWSKDKLLTNEFLSQVTASLENGSSHAAEAKKKLTPSEDRASEPSRTSKNKPSVLVIEDIPDSAKLAEKLLVKHDYRALIADSGEAALKIAKKHKPDLILLDLGLPDVDGQTLLGFLRAEENLKDTPIIVCTAWPEESTRKIVESYGFDGYLSKPYKSAEFLEVVRAHTS